MDKAILSTACRHLNNDSVMANIIKQYGQLTFNRSKPPHYHALVVAIINQQLSSKAAYTIEKRLIKLQGGRFFNNEKLLELDTTAIRECGLSNNKIHYMLTLAQAISEGRLNFRKLTRKNDDAIRSELIEYPGIGPWSVDMFLMFSLWRTDVFPVGDLAIRKSIQRFYQLPDDARHERYKDIAKNWQPYRSVASFYLWKAHD